MRARSIDAAVEYVPHPAMTGTLPFAALTALVITWRCSSAFKVATSPVVPHGTSALLPSLICHSMKSRNVSSATRPFEKGVTSAGIEPKNMNLSPQSGVFLWTNWPRSLADKERDCKMSSMWRYAVFVPVLLATAPISSAQYAAPTTYTSAPAYAATPSVAYALDQWRRLRQSSGYSFADYASFLIYNPGWPDESQMRGWAEKAMRPGENAATIIAFFAKDKPESGNGWARLTEAYAASGRTAEALSAARNAWASSDLSLTDEQSIWARYGGAFTQADQDRRIDALLFDKKEDEAGRFLAYATPQRQAAFAARIAMQDGAV